MMAIGTTLDKIELPFKTIIYPYPYGNNLGVVLFLWKVPDKKKKLIKYVRAARLVSKLNESQKVFASREMQKELTKTNKSVLRNFI